MPLSNFSSKKGFLQQKNLMNAKGRLQKGLLKGSLKAGSVSCIRILNTTNTLLIRKQMSIARAGWIYAKPYAVNYLSHCQDRMWKRESSAGSSAGPYLIAHEDDGYCVHLDRKTYKCKVREHRTVPCRGFDCRNNEQWHVWVDYEKKILNSEFEEQTDRDNSKIYSCCILNRFK